MKVKIIQSFALVGVFQRYQILSIWNRISWSPNQTSPRLDSGAGGRTLRNHQGDKNVVKKSQCSSALLWGVQVWGPLRLVRGSQMVFVCDGERRRRRRCSGGSFHRSALVSLFHLPALGSYKHPQCTALWCFDHCVYSEQSGKYVTLGQRERRCTMAQEAQRAN